ISFQLHIKVIILLHKRLEVDFSWLGKIKKNIFICREKFEQKKNGLLLFYKQQVIRSLVCQYRFISQKRSHIVINRRRGDLLKSRNDGMFIYIKSVFKAYVSESLLVKVNRY